MQFRKAIVAAGLLALPAAAMAQPIDGLYVGAGAGYNTMANQSVRNVYGPNGSTHLQQAKISNRQGFVVPASVGWGFGNGFRVEVEGNYRHTQSKLGNDVPSGAGSNQTFGAMANGFYDFDVGLPYLFPYIGVGGGYEFSKIQSITGTFPGNIPFASNTSGRIGSPAAQGMLGVGIPLAWVPGLSATVEFRYMHLFRQLTYNGATLGAAPDTTRVSYTLSDQNNYSGIVGLRYAFFTPPPPPPPAPPVVAAPAPAPARTYLVFFDWDKADLTDRARQIIAEAAQNSTKVQVTRIECNGYTDTSGTPAYNQKLSVRRAQNVAAELVKDGVPQNIITIQGFGDTHLLVPTGPGVREPQNRRVEIIFK
jgi:outer membrane protein OmpA-like peptidoglycan-associated protein